MLTTKVSSFSVCKSRLGLQAAVAARSLSAQAGDEAPPQAFSGEKKSRPSSSAAVVPKGQPHNQQQSRSYSSGASPPPAPPGTDYLSLFQPIYGNALAGPGTYSPGTVLKVYPLPRFVLKEDIMHHVKGSDVQQDNVKLVYNPVFRADFVEFEVDSAATQKQLMRRLQERGRLGCRFLRAEVSKPSGWTAVDASLKDSPRGRTLVMYNVHPSTDSEDVERFFEGYNYDAKHIRFVKVTNDQVQNRGPNRRPVTTHVAVGFTSKLEALRAMREKAGEFCANVPVSLRFIQ